MHKIKNIYSVLASVNEVVIYGVFKKSEYHVNNGILAINKCINKGKIDFRYIEQKF